MVKNYTIADTIHSHQREDLHKHLTGIRQEVIEQFHLLLIMCLDQS